MSKRETTTIDGYTFDINRRGYKWGWVIVFEDGLILNGTAWTFKKARRSAVALGDYWVQATKNMPVAR